MEQFYYADGEERRGPFTLSELKNEGITGNTLVWYEGLDDWQTAEKTEVLKEIFELLPPQVGMEVKAKSAYRPAGGEDVLDAPFVQGAYAQSTKSGGFFSFKGRIGRTEFGVSLIVYVVAYILMNFMIVQSLIFMILYIPILWFLWAQSAKRSHDIGNSGWYQLIPFYIFWLIFAKGVVVGNEYFMRKGLR